MAHLWFKKAGGFSHWTVGLLGTAACRLGGNPDGSMHIEPSDRLEASASQHLPGGGEGSSADAWLVRQDDLGRQERWILLAAAQTSPAVRCNGMPLAAGLRVLRDRDEVLFPGCEPAYFSTEKLSRVVPYPADEKLVICPRCRQPLAGLAVQCPNPQCGAWHHQSADLPCWTGYVDEGQPFSTCSLCSQPATLYPEAEFTWTPEGL